MEARAVDAYFGKLLLFAYLAVLSSLIRHADATNPIVSSGHLSDKMFRSVWSEYQSAIRPLCDAYPSTATVTMEIALRQLQELDEPKQILALNVWLRVTWSDCRLVWNTSEWGDVSRLVVPYDSVWTPDLTLYDNAESGLTGLQSYRVSVKADGSVRQQVPVVIKSLCQLDVSRFPFDTQTCNLTFGSWAYHGYEINLTAGSNPVDLSAFVKHGEWEISSMTAQRIQPFFDDLPYPQVIFTLTLRRRHLFYILSLLFPCALIQLMAGLAFLLPCETNEKVGLEITVLLSLAVMQLVILDMIPASSETLPLIGVYFMLAMIVVSLSCLMTVIVLTIHFPDRHRPLPRCARAVLASKVASWMGVDLHAVQLAGKLQGGANAVGIANPDVTVHTRYQHHNAPAKDGGNTTCSSNMELSTVCNLHADINTVNGPHQTSADVTGHGLDVSSDSDVSYYYSIEGDRSKRVCHRPLSSESTRLAQLMQHGQVELQEVMTMCRQILHVMKDASTRGDRHDSVSDKMARKEWELMALFMDRVFLVVFCLLTLTMFIYVYASIA